jgi:hypothetical protein
VGQVSVWTVGGFYLLLFAVTLCRAPLKDRFRRFFGDHASQMGWGPALVLALLAIVWWQEVFRQPDGRLHTKPWESLDLTEE